MRWSARPRHPRWAVVAAACALFAGCKRVPPSPLPGELDAGQRSGASAMTGSDGGLAAARCKVANGERAAATLADVGDRRSLEVGEGVATPDGVAVGIVHAPATGPEALVARLAGRDGESRRLVEEWVVAKRGELVPDAPPPKPLVAGGELYAAYVARSSAGDGGGSSRRIVLKKAGVAVPIAAYPERADESLAFDASLTADASRAAVVWDDDAARSTLEGESARNAARSTPNGGGITVAVAPLMGGRPLAPRVVSGDTADPDAPRIVARETAGWWVAWTAHRPESIADASAASVHRVAAVESPAEERAYSWIEVVAVGDDGAPSGPPRRITAATGHAAAFDLAPRSHGGLDVVVRDETQLREGEGGRILHVVVLPDGAAEEPTVMVQAGAGRGSVDLVIGLGGDAWLAYSDAQDRALVIPLGPARVAVGSPSIEDLLEGGRLLTVAGGAPVRFVATFPGTEGALFREVVCAP